MIRMPDVGEESNLPEDFGYEKRCWFEQIQKKDLIRLLKGKGSFSLKNTKEYLQNAVFENFHVYFIYAWEKYEKVKSQCKNPIECQFRHYESDWTRGEFEFVEDCGYGRVNIGVRMIFSEKGEK